MRAGGCDAPGYSAAMREKAHVIASGGVREDERWVRALCLTCRKLSQMSIETGVARLPRDESGGIPVYCPDGLRHIGSMSPDRLSYGTCEGVSRYCRLISGGEREDSNRQNPGGAEYRCGTRWRTRP